MAAPRGRCPGLRSAVYEGTLHHRRFGPGTAHEFSYDVAMPLLDLAEIDAVTGLHPLWSSRRPGAGVVPASGLPGRPGGAAGRGGTRPRRGAHRAPTRRARVACWRTCARGDGSSTPSACTSAPSRDGTGIETLVAEVENTPWHERCSYVVGPPGRHRFAKTMHVSPFLPMDVDYELRYTAPTERLVVHFDVMRGDERLLGATLSLRRRALDRRALGRLLWAYPALTHRVSAGIYAQAARLRLRGAPFHAHPARRATARPGRGSRR